MIADRLQSIDFCRIHNPPSINTITQKYDGICKTDNVPSYFHFWPEGDDNNHTYKDINAAYYDMDYDISETKDGHDLEVLVYNPKYNRYFTLAFNGFMSITRRNK